ncbi:MAG: arylamine N-acetyltransferase [Bacteroidetes bacterium]|nr:arylamine N-acetyltransferase [Bacteroidota bacterium]MBL6944028.1 arylamine N-acetyltransferase [Bacteroidales bacterium]
MLKSKFEHRLFLRYLRLLEIQKQRPSFEYLKKIVRAQISKIPFENISKLYYKKHFNLKQLIDFELYLDGIEKYGFGGTCYSNNFYLNQLLSWLGYEIKLCGADMKNPDVHLVNIVNIENREFLVDTGYAAPFSEPLPIDLLYDYTIHMGLDRYIVKPKTNHNSQIELYRNGELKHGYKINPGARNIGEFQQVIENSFKASATFMNALLLTRFDNNNFVVIHNRTIIETYGKVMKKNSLGSVEQLASVINDRFNIPEAIVIESIAGLQMHKNGWS